MLGLLSRRWWGRWGRRLSLGTATCQACHALNNATTATATAAATTATAAIITNFSQIQVISLSVTITLWANLNK